MDEVTREAIEVSVKNSSKYLRRAVGILETYFHLKPSMGERMLLRREMEKACERQLKASDLSGGYMDLCGKVVLGFLEKQYGINPIEDVRRVNELVIDPPLRDKVLSRSNRYE